MKRLILPMLLISVAAQALTPAGAARIRLLESKMAPELKLPPMQRWDLSNGWHVILAEDHSLPLISAKMLLRVSTVFVPENKVGAAGMMTRLLRSGGTLATPPDQLDRELDQMAIRISDSISSESAEVTMGTMSRFAAPAFRHFFDIIFTPRFDVDRFDVIRRRRLDEIRRQNDVPAEIAQREFVQWLEGDSPWGRMPTRKSISNVDLDDIRSFYQTHFSRGEKWLVVTGDITRSQLETLLQPALPLDRTPVQRETLPQLHLPDSPGVRIVKKQATQAAIVVGHAGTDRYNPDKYALLVMNDILGGSPFTNRLMKAIRTERGLAYSVGSSFGFGPKEAPGLFTASAMTRAEKAGDVVGLIKEIITRMHNGDGITEAELQISKRAIMSSTLFDFAEPFNAASATARFSLYGYPEGYVQAFRRRIMQVTLADVQRVAKQYLHPDQLRILVVGDPKTLRSQLAPFGKVEMITPSQ